MARLRLSDLQPRYRRQAIAQHGTEAFRRQRRHKYSACPTSHGGVRYASKAEASRAVELDLLIRAGDLKRIDRQVRIALGIAENVYVVDFVVTPMRGRPWAEDVKGYETPAFKRHKRLWRRYGPMPLLILKRRGRGWSRETIAGGMHHDGGNAEHGNRDQSGDEA